MLRNVNRPLKLFQIFDALRERDETFSEKLVPVEVNYSTHDLNINSQLLEIIQREVQVKGCKRG